jgi:hypothetical protein
MFFSPRFVSGLVYIFRQLVSHSDYRVLRRQVAVVYILLLLRFRITVLHDIHGKEQWAVYNMPMHGLLNKDGDDYIVEAPSVRCKTPPLQFPCTRDPVIPSSNSPLHRYSASVSSTKFKGKNAHRSVDMSSWASGTRAPILLKVSPFPG